MPRNQESSQSSLSIENINLDINLDFEATSPFQEDVISETFQRPDKSFFQDPKELNNLIYTGNLTLSMPHMIIVSFSHLVREVPLQELSVPKV